MTTLEEYNKMFEESEKIGKEAIIDCIGFIVENDRIGIMIQDFFPERLIKEIIDYIEEKKEYFYLGIEVRDNDRYLIFKRDKSKLLDLSKLFSD